MVKGLLRFKKHFEAYSDQYVLIGGTACSLVMEDVGLEFRATKDLDIVLCIEAIDKSFISAFWDFVNEGGYKNRQRSSGKEVFYRFDNPNTADFPSILELFSRVTDMDKIGASKQVTRVKLDEFATSLSALLFNDEYYRFIQDGKTVINGFSVVKASHLIPLKAKAWLDLASKKHAGHHIDSNDIRKHKKDVLRLHQILTPGTRVSLSHNIKMDMQDFINRLKQDDEIDLKNLNIKNWNKETLFRNLEAIYLLDQEPFS